MFRYIIEQDKQLVLEPLPYSKEDLDPVMSKETIDYHYSKLASGYVERFNKGKGDPVFNQAGAFLHNLFFPQLREPTNNNKPFGASELLIKDKFGSFDKFKKAFAIEAMKVQGSGWVYLSTDGSIKIIPNHQVRRDIAMIIDWWEHAWALDYQADKSKYLDGMWSLINWHVVNDRLNK